MSTQRQNPPGRLKVDRVVTVDVDGCAQSVLVRAERRGLPPLLVVQAGPGLPLRHEADRFRANLNLEQAFEVRYWDQRGCGPVDQRDAYGVSLPRQAAVTPVRRLNNSRPQNLPFVSNRRANCASGRYTSDLPDIGDPCPVTRAYPDAG
jgi:pimeloyl-ACP methyl ester carboxylesterase